MTAAAVIVVCFGLVSLIAVPLYRAVDRVMPPTPSQLRRRQLEVICERDEVTW